jgi:hypothetical protein
MMPVRSAPGTERRSVRDPRASRPATSKRRAACRLGAIAALAAVLAGCGAGSLPGPRLGRGAESDERMAALLENRVWRADRGEAGAAMAFLSDGTLIRLRCDGGYRLAAWRWVSQDTLVFDGEGGTQRAEVGLVGADVLALVLPDGESRSYSRLQGPYACS